MAQTPMPNNAKQLINENHKFGNAIVFLISPLISIGIDESQNGGRRESRRTI
jgi:hypothetical protein